MTNYPLRRYAVSVEVETMRYRDATVFFIPVRAVMLHGLRRAPGTQLAF